MPEQLQDRSKRPAAGTRRRLLSGEYISGSQIAVDLIEEHLVVQGKGNLLVRDYRVPVRRGGEPAERTSLLLGDVSSGSLTSYSPGHTVFTWQNGMSFLSQKNIAVFDRQVEMVHRSGSLLEMTPELAAATGLDADTLADLKGRKVGLTTDHLVVEFQRDAKARGADPASLSRATRLRAFDAAGRVHMQEGGRSLEGAEVTYNDETGIVLINGTARSPAQALAIDEATGALQVEASGEFVEWNVKTQKVRVKQPRGFGSGPVNCR